METDNTQDLLERALENAIETLDLVAIDPTLDRRFREAQKMCNQALIELRGFGHETQSEEWSGQ